MCSTSELARLIHKRHQILVQLRELGKRQGSLIEQEDTSTLLRLLSVKQRVLAGLQETERQLAPYHADDPDSRIWPNPRERDQCATEAQQCQQLLLEVLELERQQEQWMLQRRNQAATQLRRVQAASEATGAYHANRWTADQSQVAKRPHLLASSSIPLDLSSEA